MHVLSEQRLFDTLRRPRKRRALPGGLRHAVAQWPQASESGDLWGMRAHGDGTVTLVVADVSGNGPSAAGFAVQLRRALSAYLDQHRRPSDLLGALNERIERTAPADRFVSAVAARIDTRSARLDVARAGHLGPVVKRRQGRALAVAWPCGPALGLLPHQRYDEDRLDLGDDDAVVFVTDGITDRLAAPGDPLGERRLVDRLAKGPGTPWEICAHLGEVTAAAANAGACDATVLAVSLAA